MVEHAVLADARAAVHAAFNGQELFSCLAGSIAAGTHTPSSDVDLVVVLPPTMPVSEAIARRVRFTIEYINLHRRHEREPDSDWPGEVLYAPDLDAARDGGAFTLDSGQPGLPLSSESEPYRYWVSMIATGVSLTHPVEHARAALQCSTTIAHHAFRNMILAGPAGPPPTDVARHPAWQDWHLAPGCIDMPGALTTAIARDSERLRLEGAGFLERWHRLLHQPTAAPPLDGGIACWRATARQADRSLR